MKVVLVHDDDCPLGVNGLRAYWEARNALSSLPPEALSTDEDKISASIAAYELEQCQVCRCAGNVESSR